MDAGEKVAISGASGCGKSTLLKIIIGQRRPDTGAVRLWGKTLSAQTAKEIRANLYYLPQEIRPVGDETVDEYLRAPFQLAVNKDRSYDAAAAAAMLAEVSLGSELLPRRLADLSGGERKRVGLVRGLLQDRPLLLLDELTSSVDEGNRRRMVDLVTSDAARTILAVTHDEYFMERASRHLELSGARLRPAGG